MIRLQILLFPLLFTAALGFPLWQKLSTTGKYNNRGETSFSQCGGTSLCLIGGRGPNYVDILDTATLRWTSGATNELSMHHVQPAFAPDGCVWLAGAWTGEFPNETAISDIWKYCLPTDTWSVVTSIARPRGAAGSVWYKGKLYLVSGNQGGHNPSAKVIPFFDCYDPAKDEWTVLPNIPHPRDHFHAVVHDDKLYAVGGRDSTSDPEVFFNDTEVAVDVFDFKTNKWTSIADFPRPRAGLDATVFNNTVLVAGGEGHGRAFSEVDVLKGDSFVPGPDMPEPRHGMGIVSCAGALWVAGGDRVQGSGSRAVTTLAYFSGEVPPVCTAAPTPPSTNPTAEPPVTKPPTTTYTTNVETVAVNSPDPSSDGTETTPPISSNPDTSRPTSAPTTIESTDPQAASPGPSPTGSIAPGSGDNSSQSESESLPVESEEAGADCFPSDATVELANGHTSRMADLRIGDVVKVAHPDKFSEIFFFSHHHPNVRASIVKIETSHTGTMLSLSLSPGHLLRVNGKLQAAGSVKVGDVVNISPTGHAEGLEDTAVVTATSRRVSNGLHNPHTLHGDIVVNGVVASTYTTTVHPIVARTLLFPVRAAYRAIGAHWSVEAANGFLLRAIALTYWKD